MKLWTVGSLWDPAVSPSKLNTDVGFARRTWIPKKPEPPELVVLPLSFAQIELLLRA